jgi:hypothetical protein
MADTDEAKKRHIILALKEIFCRKDNCVGCQQNAALGTPLPCVVFKVTYRMLVTGVQPLTNPVV